VPDQLPCRIKERALDSGFAPFRRLSNTTREVTTRWGDLLTTVSRLNCKSAPADVLALAVMSYLVLPVLVAQRSGCSSILHDETRRLANTNPEKFCSSGQTSCCTLRDSVAEWESNCMFSSKTPAGTFVDCK